jgi:hypothetical protein
MTRILLIVKPYHQNAVPVSDLRLLPCNTQATLVFLHDKDKMRSLKLICQWHEFYGHIFCDLGNIRKDACMYIYLPFLGG